MIINLSLQINGETRQIDADPDRTLLSVLRDDLGLTGAKYGCGDGKCGACTLLVDGNPTQSCSITVGAAAGSHITTVEGLEKDGRLHRVQEAFLAAGALQCGYCTPGMIMSAVALLNASPQPSASEITHFMQDNICRCGSYRRILTAIQAAAAAETRSAGQPAFPSSDDRIDQNIDGGASDEEAMDEGIFVAYPCPDLNAVLYGEGAAPAPEERPLTKIGPWVHVAPDGAITVYVGKAEVGQNIRTSLAQIVAEELRVPARSVRVVMGDTGRAPFDMGTFGSRTTPITGRQLWRAGAATRELLLDLAAATWNVERATLSIEGGAVRHPATGRSARYGDLVRDRQILRIAHDDQATTPAEDWTVAGQSVAKLNGRSFVTGRHKFASDTRRPGMLHGKVLRPPAFHATLDSLDASAAEAMEGVTVVHEGDFVGVAAPDELTATQAVEAIRARWKIPLQVSQPELFAYLKTKSRAGGRSPQSLSSGRGFGTSGASGRLSDPPTDLYG